MRTLIIDDERQVRDFLSTVLCADGWQVGEAATAEQAFEKLKNEQWSVVFCDVMLGSLDGFAVLERFVEEQPDAKVILMTGNGSASGALKAVSSGAYDYLLKPFSVAQIRRVAETVKARIVDNQLKTENEEEVATPYHNSKDELIGRSAPFLEVVKLVARMAQTNLPVLITGESGTGKEVIARELHRRSRRASKAFIAVNCGALSAELIESELFGHVRGSFTGADRDRVGLFEEADGGTVFLDEVTETSPAFQVKLLRALQQGEIRRVGSNRIQNVNVRIIAATNRNLETEVKAGRFRQDLLYRLNAVDIHLPPLRERREDILLIAQHFAQQAREEKQSSLCFSAETISLLESYSWPGNIRELENVIIRAAALCDHIARPEDLPEHLHRHTSTTPDGELNKLLEGYKQDIGVTWPLLSEIEERYVANVMTHTKGNKQAASRLLGIDRKTIERVIKRSQPNSNESSIDA